MANDRSEYQRGQYLKRKEAAAAAKAKPHKLQLAPDSAVQSHAAPLPKKQASRTSENGAVPCIITAARIMPKMIAVKKAALKALGLLAFMAIGGLNFAFLVIEQLHFYAAIGYSQNYAIFVAVLSELAIVTISVIYSMSCGWARFRAWLLLVATMAAVCCIIMQGVERSQSTDSNRAEVISLMRREIAELEDKARQERDNTALRKSLTRKLSGLKTALETNPPSGNVTRETIVLAFLRILAMFWNVLMAGFLVKLLKRK